MQGIYRTREKCFLYSLSQQLSKSRAQIYLKFQRTVDCFQEPAQVEQHRPPDTDTLIFLEDWFGRYLFKPSKFLRQ